MMDYPILIFALCFFSLWLAVYIGASLARKSRKLLADERADLGVVLTAALTLLGLIIGFTFSMAVTRYDQRKDLEAAEANAIGTEIARTGLMPAVEAAKTRELLRSYLKQRALFYTTRDEDRIQQIRMATAQMQANLWSTVQDYAASKPTPIAALVVSGMNDVLNSQAYTQASWWNRIPAAAWVLMAVIAIFCCGLLGYAAHRPEGEAGRVIMLPLIVATSFFLIADIDSPRGGVIRIHPLNLEDVYWSSGRP